MSCCESTGKVMLSMCQFKYDKLRAWRKTNSPYARTIVNAASTMYKDSSKSHGAACFRSHTKHNQNIFTFLKVRTGKSFASTNNELIPSFAGWPSVTVQYCFYSDKFEQQIRKIRYTIGKQEHLTFTMLLHAFFIKT